MTEPSVSTEETSEEQVISFRKPTRRAALRKPKPEEIEKDGGSDEDDERIERKLRDIQEVQKLRKRRNGMTALECALGKRIASEFDELEDNPFKSRSGNMMTLPEDKKKKLTAEDITTGMQDQFHKEELLFDEDEEMKKYIEANMNQSRSVTDTLEAKNARFCSAEDEILHRVAEKVRAYSSKKDDELLSNQMLAGIPEVDLGIEARMKNVLETEKLKGDMIANGGKPPPSEEKPKKYKRFRID
ncbi:unnamed protein product [Bursaphelenchus xylophilus]|uniref:(pine wood nematode) hypothetical protein n=1 Tax=Bursaphelenchus xylophilus TaxID=6326 RepID=A0A1I7S7P8_BURXY|nr:unnamed protein product [Bursaphelenchus xylophilus]CAG9086832.1 unnamed protein product [Bursaphelenchus xylophilus]